MSCPSPTRRYRLILPLAFWLASAVSGCSGGDSSYPSLATRPAERLTDAPPTAAGARMPAANPGAAASADLAARLQKLVVQASSAERDFADQRAGAAKAIGAGSRAAIGSDDWARATQALAGLESARSLTAQPLAQIDRIDIDNRMAHPGVETAPNADADAIAAARATVDGMVAEEDATLAKLDWRAAR